MNNAKENIRRFQDPITGEIFDVRQGNIFEALPEEVVRGVKKYSEVEGEEYKRYKHPGKCWLVEDEEILADFAEVEEYIYHWEGSNYTAICIRNLDGYGQVEEILK